MFRDGQLFIELTPEEKAFLRQFAQEHKNDVYRTGTRHAFFLVEAEEGQSVECEDGDTLVHEGSAYKDIPTLIETLREYGEDIPPFNKVEGSEVNDVYIYDHEDYLKAFKIKAYRVRTVKYWKPLAFFFTHAEAVRYRDGYQSHNCKGYGVKTRIYACSAGYDNRGDFPALQALLLRMGKALAEGEGS